MTKGVRFVVLVNANYKPLCDMLWVFSQYETRANEFIM